MKKLFCLLMLIMVTGCATNPDNLPTSYQSEGVYADYDCSQLLNENRYVNDRISVLYSSLSEKATNDAAQFAIGMFVAWPVLLFLEGGDGPEAAEYSRLRGESEAIRSAMVQKKCHIVSDSVEVESTSDSNKVAKKRTLRTSRLSSQSLAKLISNDNSSSYRYICTAVSIGRGLFLTSSHCLGRYNYLYSTTKTQIKVEVLHKGHSYGSGNTINAHEENYAIIYAPGLPLPPVTISDEGMNEGEEYCVLYLETKDSHKRSRISQSVTPTRVCGVAGELNNLHRDVLWGGKMQKQSGFWGAPVVNSNEEIVGIISWRYTNDFQRAGVLASDVFLKEVRGRNIN